MNQRFRKRIVDLPTQPANGDIDQVRISLAIHVPDFFSDEFAPESLPDVTGQKYEESELFLGEFQLPRAASDDMRYEVDFELSDSDVGSRSGPRRKMERMRASNSENANGFTK
jgi:hypothetical protein